MITEQHLPSNVNLITVGLIDSKQLRTEEL